MSGTLLPGGLGLAGRVGLRSEPTPVLARRLRASGRGGSCSLILGLAQAGRTPEGGLGEERGAGGGLCW